MKIRIYIWVKSLVKKKKKIAYGLGQEEGYKVNYSLSPQEFLRAEPEGTPERFQ